MFEIKKLEMLQGGQADEIFPKVEALIQELNANEKTEGLLRTPRKAGYVNKHNSIVTCDTRSVNKATMKTLAAEATKQGLKVDVWMKGSFPEVFFELAGS